MSRSSLLALCGGVLLASVASSAASEPIDFARDVYPVLQRACFECHGSRKQEADLRLDHREHALRDSRIIARGSSATSELVRRISLPKGHDDVMPVRGAPLRPAEIAKIKAWIDAGASWPENLRPMPHWSYVAPRRPVPPESRDKLGADAHPVDRFLLARLQSAGLTFSPPAERPVLLRRLSLDLIGLPPTLAEIDDFVRDSSPNAYEKQVDRLLQSEQFGVRWARPWLDYARYADSHGFQRDDFRDLWLYRDWVVKAFNADMPYTQFSLEQLAGDLLPNATESQRIATGFNRCAPTNVEAGSDPEETRVNQIHDRLNTLGMVWLGATLECAQCHDHKYDPLTMQDYYGLFAFFNNTALEADRTNPKAPGSIQFQGPLMHVEEASRREERERRTAELAAVDRKLAALRNEAESDLAAWEDEFRKKVSRPSQEHVLEIAEFTSTGGATHEILPDRSVLIGGEPAPDTDTYVVQVRTKLTEIRALKLEALADDSLPGKGPGRGDEKRPNFVLNNLTVTAAPASRPEASSVVKFTRAKASFSQSNYPVSNLLQANDRPQKGWAIAKEFSKPHWALLETARSLGDAEGIVLTFKLEQFYGGGRTIGRLRLGAITGDPDGETLPADLAAALETPAPRRTAEQRALIRDRRAADLPGFPDLAREKHRLELQLRNLKPDTTLVMQENTPRRSRVFQRGDFRNPGEDVAPAIPAVWRTAASASATGGTRLDLARWLVSRDNPLAARVAVNRWWSELFGQGLVSTPEDFGLQGERPLHGELLDWLACEFMDQGWSTKKLLKTLVTSRAYQQSAKTTPELLAADDRNLLLARGPRQRLEAELIRDNALAIAGLLQPKLGGPPIRPYQPDGLWIKVGGQRYDYEVSPGDEKYRRGLYVVWKRAAPYPSFVNFDANNRMACRVTRPRSNTPLQALTLLNDPVYVEAALAFARRVLVEQPRSSDDARLTHAFRLATARTAGERELKVLRAYLAAERETWRARPDDAKKFLGDFAPPDGVSAEELTAWYGVAAALLNLDETITKG